MDDFAGGIAAREKGARKVFSLKPFNPAVFVHRLPAPNADNSPCAVFSIWLLCLTSNLARITFFRVSSGESVIDVLPFLEFANRLLDRDRRALDRIPIQGSNHQNLILAKAPRSEVTF
jgi:hypothetical protein